MDCINGLKVCMNIGLDHLYKGGPDIIAIFGPRDKNIAIIIGSAL